MCPQGQNLCPQWQNLCSQGQNLCPQRQNLCPQGQNSCPEILRGTPDRKKLLENKDSNQPACCLLAPIIKPFSDTLKEACKNKNQVIKDRANQVRLSLLASVKSKIIYISGSALHIKDIIGNDSPIINFNDITDLPSICSKCNIAVNQAGDKILFVGYDREKNRDIYKLDITEKKCYRLTEDTADDFAPSWSPDGTKITFTSTRDGNDEIYVMDADGKNQKRLTENKTNDSMPVWRPDGTFIAFISDRDGTNTIYTMNPDGTNQQKVLSLKADNISALGMHPDGTKIAFASNRSGKYEIYTAGGMGDEITQITKCPEEFEFVGSPIWSPDVTQIAFAAKVKGQHEIYIMPARPSGGNVDGSNMRNISNNPEADDLSPAWIPSDLKKLSILFSE
ncbi:MAG: PD40 domain-containing protein [Planctomycetes bacterium]|nr:PD40 domain-containing protein [Planctomycetota bacterium]